MTAATALVGLGLTAATASASRTKLLLPPGELAPQCYFGGQSFEPGEHVVAEKVGENGSVAIEIGTCQSNGSWWWVGPF
jgi:hypothetical protein